MRAFLACMIWSSIWVRFSQKNRVFLYFVIDCLTVVNGVSIFPYLYKIVRKADFLKILPKNQKEKSIGKKNFWKKKFSARRTCTLLHKLSASGLVRLVEKLFLQKNFFPR